MYGRTRTMMDSNWTKNRTTKDRTFWRTVIANVLKGHAVKMKISFDYKTYLSLRKTLKQQNSAPNQLETGKQFHWISNVIPQWQYHNIIVTFWLTFFFGGWVFFHLSELKVSREESRKRHVIVSVPYNDDYFLSFKKGFAMTATHPKLHPVKVSYFPPLIFLFNLN